MTLYGTLLLLAVAAVSSALPLDNAIHETDLSSKQIEEAVVEHFKNIDYQQMIGEPDEATGARVAAYRPESGTSPETLGSYYQGDLLLPSDSVARNGVVNPANRWTRGVVPYSIDGTFTAAELTTINNAIAQFTLHTCIRFVHHTTQRDYVSIDNVNAGCWATAGRTGGKQVVNLQSPACLYYVATAIHELNHALGFLHEQSRADRDAYVTINWQNIKYGFASNFDIYSPPLSGFGIKYDYDSIMHYGSDAFSANGQPTITPLNPTQSRSMGQRNGFSAGDVYKINRMYNCTGYHMGP